MMYGWKRLADDTICQTTTAPSKPELFIKAGFGPVLVNYPIKGMIAVRVRRDKTGRLIEIASDNGQPDHSK